VRSNIQVRRSKRRASGKYRHVMGKPSADAVDGNIPENRFLDLQLLRDVWHKARSAGMARIPYPSISSRPDFDRTPQEQLREELRERDSNLAMLIHPERFG